MRFVLADGQERTAGSDDLARRRHQATRLQNVCLLSVARYAVNVLNYSVQNTGEKPLEVSTFGRS